MVHSGVFQDSKRDGGWGEALFGPDAVLFVTVFQEILEQERAKGIKVNGMIKVAGRV